MSESAEGRQVRMSERFKNVEEKVDKILKIFEGEGNDSNPGLLIRMDRLEQADKLRRKIVWLLASCVIGLCLDKAWDYISASRHPVAQHTTMESDR